VKREENVTAFFLGAILTRMSALLLILVRPKVAFETSRSLTYFDEHLLLTIFIALYMFPLKPANCIFSIHIDRHRRR
jgi:hypothetical protein